MMSRIRSWYSADFRALRRGSSVVGAVVALFGAQNLAWADAEACIAASESEVGLRKDEKLLAAMEKLAVCGAPSCPNEIRFECRRRLVALNAALPSLVLAAT